MTMKSSALIAVFAASTAAAFSPARKNSAKPIISSSRAAGKTLEAILFDCDGVLADTERDGHRLAFNRAFQLNGIEEDWSEQRYGKLLEVGGGKVRNYDGIKYVSSFHCIIPVSCASVGWLVVCQL
jgi:hypothetical protein